MDDRDLEARLATHLHRRFDEAHPSTELRSSVAQLFATQPRRVSLLDLPAIGRRSPMRLGFSLTAAAVAVVVLAVAASNLGLHLGPSAGGGPSPSPSGPTERSFIVLPPNAEVPTKAEATVAGDVLMARLRALGVGTFSMSGGYGMTFTLETGGPSDEAIRAVLSAIGDAEFVPLPATDYGNGKLEPVIGRPLPLAEPPLFNTAGLAMASLTTPFGGSRSLDLELTPAASRLVAQWSAAHVGEQLAVVIDGTVAELPIIQAPVTGGTIQVTNDAGPATETPVSWAILIGGMLPAAWRDAPVPKVITGARASTLALIQANDVNGAGIADMPQLDAEQVNSVWRAVWTVDVTGTFAIVCDSGTQCPPRAGIAIVKIDAVSALPISLDIQ
jgi:hypothetical protein